MRLVACLLACSISFSPLAAFAQNAVPANAPDAPKTTDAPKTVAAKTAEEVQMELGQTSQELRKVLGSPDALSKADKRKEIAPKAIPLMKKMLAGFVELGNLVPEQKMPLENAKAEFLSMLAIFDDADSIKQLDDMSKLPGDPGIQAKLSLLSASYIKASADEAAQNKVVDEVATLAKANPKSDPIAITLMRMGEMGPATPAVKSRTETIITDQLTGEAATQMSTQIKGARKMRDAVDKPVEFASTDTNGKAFSTKDWKGKVVLVDFWATWCGPCLKELPKVKKAYLEYHAKGLEIVGISCDEDLNTLKAFLEKNKDMPWPQMFDPTANVKEQWHPLAKEWGVMGIPTMFLIDKKGVLRSVEARENFEEMIPKLLDEK